MFDSNHNRYIHYRKKNFFLKFTQGALHIFLYQLTKFESVTCNCKGFRDILKTKFHSDPLK